MGNQQYSAGPSSSKDGDANPKAVAQQPGGGGGDGEKEKPAVGDAVGASSLVVVADKPANPPPPKDAAVPPIPKSPSLLDLVCRQIFPPPPLPEDGKQEAAAAASATQQRPPHPPWLWGCRTAEEHRAAVEFACRTASDRSGRDGLRALGFEYRPVHHHPTDCGCACAGVRQGDGGGGGQGGDCVDEDDDDDGDDDDADDDDDDSAPEGAAAAAAAAVADDEPPEPADDDADASRDDFFQDDLSSTDDDDDDNRAGAEEREPRRDGDDDGDNDDGGDDIDHIGETFLVPIGIPLVQSVTNLLLVDDDDEDGADDEPTAAAAASSMPRNASNVSLFSLATHDSTGSSSKVFPSRDRDGSGGGGGGSRPTTKDGATATATAPRRPGPDPAAGCALRLHHVPSGGTLLTADNYPNYIAAGKMYDEVARLCTEHAQALMAEEGDLRWEAIGGDGGGDEFGALVSRCRRSSCERPDGGSSRSSKKKKNVLLVVTGKGLVRAGIFSRRLLITTGVEPATALPWVREARARGMEIVVLDPNARGDRWGMQVTEASLQRLFLERRAPREVPPPPEEEEEDIYVLAHSMAGAQLVRFFINKLPSTAAVSSAAPANKSGNGGNQREEPPGEQAAAWSFFRSIKAVAFTDSNHNINWTKRSHPLLADFLEGPACLYIKSHKVHDSARALGERHHDCHFWRHRFGRIRTLWAGTREHALTNYAARDHIWRHFDSFLLGRREPAPNGDDGDGGEEEAPSC